MTRRRPIGSLRQFAGLPALALATVVLCGLIAALPAVGMAPKAPEQDLKAAFVFHFMKYVEWPDAKRPGAGEPLRIGVVGPGPIHKAVAEFQEQTVGGHPLEISPLDPGQPTDEYHLLFIGETRRTALTDLLRRTRGTGVLTVGDSPGFLEAGGMIEMRVVENSLRFDVNLDSSRSEGLTISSKLLRLAGNVEGSEPREGE